MTVKQSIYGRKLLRFRPKTKKTKIHFRPKTKMAETIKNSHFRRRKRKRKRISVGLYLWWTASRLKLTTLSDLSKEGSRLYALTTSASCRNLSYWRKLIVNCRLITSLQTQEIIRRQSRAILFLWIQSHSIASKIRSTSGKFQPKTYRNALGSHTRDKLRRPSQAPPQA